MEAKCSASLLVERGGQDGLAASSPNSSGSRKGRRPSCEGIQHAQSRLPWDGKGMLTVIRAHAGYIGFEYEE